LGRLLLDLRQNNLPSVLWEGSTGLERASFSCAKQLDAYREGIPQKLQSRRLLFRHTMTNELYVG
jgi:hypothetical protein